MDNTTMRTKTEATKNTRQLIWVSFFFFIYIFKSLFCFFISFLIFPPEAVETPLHILPNDETCISIKHAQADDPDILW